MFKTNHLSEVGDLISLKSQLIHVDHLVLQHVYEVVQQTGLVREILLITFPELYNKAAQSRADQVMSKAREIKAPSNW